MWARPLLCPDRAFDEVGSWVGWCWRRVWALFELGGRRPVTVSMTIFIARKIHKMYLFMNLLFVILCPLGTKGNDESRNTKPNGSTNTAISFT